jgi:hypothetical protein
MSSPDPKQRAAGGARAPILARLYAFAAVGAVVLAGAASIEMWPLTGWHLFSELRHPVRKDWKVFVVDAKGQEQPLPFAKLKPVDRHVPLVMRTFPSATESAQLKVCATWAEGGRKAGIDVAEVRIYRFFTDLRKHKGTYEQPTPTRRLYWTCSADRIVHA